MTRSGGCTYTPMYPWLQADLDAIENVHVEELKMQLFHVVFDLIQGGGVFEVGNKGCQDVDARPVQSLDGDGHRHPAWFVSDGFIHGLHIFHLEKWG